jgi:hypothetical protein
MSKSMPSGDFVLRQEFIHRPGMVEAGCFVSNVVGQSPLPGPHRAMGPACLSALDLSRSSENRTVPGGITSSMVLYLSPGTCKKWF